MTCLCGSVQVRVNVPVSSSVCEYKGVNIKASGVVPQAPSSFFFFFFSEIVSHLSWTHQLI